jgi:S-adenosylmethionine:tRNA ribosyltransferase-isomerase
MASARVIADFELPAHLEAAEPPEGRGLARDDVRLLVSNVARDAVAHACFRDLPRWLSPGDLLVVNASGTLAAALFVETERGESLELHLSTRLPGGFWTAEVRRPDYIASVPYRDARAGLILRLPDGASATLLAPYPYIAESSTRPMTSGPSEAEGWQAVGVGPHGKRRNAPSRLWLAALDVPAPVHDYLARHGVPIRYRYVPEPWPLSMYQTIFATEPGSAEMPSAGRPFTSGLVSRLGSQGVQFASIVLHTGVASLEDHEPPYEEWYRVPPETAERVNITRRNAGRVIGVGTTVVRALETVTDARGVVHPGEGWTSLVIGANTTVRSVNGLITGLHEPRATHLAMLERVADAAARAAGHPSPSVARHLERAYAEARQAGYLWHEFGDAHLIL